MAPFFGYARQDKKHRGREPISARLTADLFADRGASQVIAAATHGVFSGDAGERLEKAGLAQLVTTNTLPLPEGFPAGRPAVLSIAPLLARAICEAFLEGSVTGLFEGESQRSSREEGHGRRLPWRRPVMGRHMGKPGKEARFLAWESACS